VPPLAATLKPSWSVRFWDRAAVVKRPAYSRFVRPGCSDRALPVKRRGGARSGSRRCRDWRGAPFDHNLAGIPRPADIEAHVRARAYKPVY
jgi:hypothetical protein